MENGVAMVTTGMLGVQCDYECMYVCIKSIRHQLINLSKLKVIEKEILRAYYYSILPKLQQQQKKKGKSFLL